MKKDINYMGKLLPITRGSFMVRNKSHDLYTFTCFVGSRDENPSIILSSHLIGNF